MKAVTKTTELIDTIDQYIIHDKPIHAWEMFIKLIDTLGELDFNPEDTQRVATELDKFKQYFAMHGDTKFHKQMLKNKNNTHQRIDRLIDDNESAIKMKVMQGDYREAKKMAKNLLITIGDIGEANPSHFRHVDDNNKHIDEPHLNHYFDHAVEIAKAVNNSE